jgi:hypothetical protein
MREFIAARRTTTAVATAFAALALAACGGGGGDGEDDDKAVRALFESHRAAHVEGDVETYCNNFSDAELKRTDIPRERCLELEPDSIKEDGAEGAKITKVKIDGNKATITYTLGGESEPETGTVVKEDGKWKVSDLTFF